MIDECLVCLLHCWPCLRRSLQARKCHFHKDDYVFLL
uniref:Uncharacterized protein n=1 Tax=Arundo donax TaxID=35708 RepID=A0A0A9BKU8_ARUDO